MTELAAPVRVIEETAAYWRIVFDYPPFNMVDADDIRGSPESAHSNRRQPKPPCRRVREREP